MSATYLVGVLDIVHGILLLEMLLGMDPQKETQRKSWSGAWQRLSLAASASQIPEALGPSLLL